MSYDVCVGPISLNYTSNGCALFYDHMPPVDTDQPNRPDHPHLRGGLWTLHGLTGAEAALLIADAFTRIEQTRMKLWEDRVVGEPEFCKLYDSPNGWGSTIGALLFLARIQAACVHYPSSMVEVYA